MTGVQSEKKGFGYVILAARKTCENCKTCQKCWFRPSPFPNSKSNLNDAVIAAAQTTISDWPGYIPTPLISLEAIAAACRVRAVYYKDESHRFDLKSFKALGGAYAVAQLVNAEKKNWARP